ncbi:MAG: sensor histidine kinase [Chloroflexia bacterium]
MNRLWVRLTLAFALVILVAVGVIALLAGLTAGREFHRYLAYSDIWPNQALVDYLAGYYRFRGDWQGIAAILDREARLPNPRIGARRGLWAGPLRFVLADAEGRVVYDGVEGRPGRPLRTEERAAAQEIEVDGTVAGFLVTVVLDRPAFLGPLEEIFLSRLQWWLALGAILAGLLGLLLGVVLSRGLTAPLRRLAEAAHAVANRDFSRRVQAEGSTELVEVARAFNQMTAALEEAERQRRNMVADIAHELRTPLSVLQGNLQAILDDVYPLDKEEIARLYDETRLLSRLVDDLRELALADAGQLRLNLQPLQVAPIVQATVDGLALAAESQGVSLSVELPEDLPLVQADPDRLGQVLRNLLVNALQHTPAGGSVVVRAAPTAGAVEIAVSDTGEGIAPEDLPHVFERFWRADTARSRDRRWAGGTGLGLSVAQSLVQAQGGRIWAESAPGRGSTFRFTLPLACNVADRTSPA